MGPKENMEPKERILGLDLGKASIGWALVEFEKNESQRSGAIIACGARTFQAADIGKADTATESPNTPRREARGARRLLRRKARRMARIRNLIIDSGILPADRYRAANGKLDIDVAFTNLHNRIANQSTPWQLRSEALDRRLDPESWAIVLLHLAKRRGFKSNSKRDLADAKGKEHGTKEGLKTTRELSQKYRTAGEMAYKSEEFKHAKRNKQGNYNRSIERDLLHKEINTLFEQQKTFGNPHADDSLRDQYLELWSAQRHYDQGNVKSMIGRCTLEPTQPRAPRRGWSHERFMLLQKINNLRILDPFGGQVTLSADERRQLIDHIYAASKTPSSKITYKSIRKLLNLSTEKKFNGIKYNIDFVALQKQEQGEKIKDPESELFASLPGWSALRKAIEDLPDGDSQWQSLSNNHTLLDYIAETMTYHKDDAKITQLLKEKGIDAHVIDTITYVTAFTKVGHLSRKALQKIIPHLEQGHSYDKACEHAGYDFQPKSSGKRSTKLPMIPPDEVLNPVVRRVLTQARKLINAIVAKYGPPHLVNIELLRDVAASDERKKEIIKGQKHYQKNKEFARDDFRKLFDREPKESELTKFRFAKEQNFTCPYSGVPFDTRRIINDPTYTEIDHILPYSRSLDDSQNNKVLCLTDENRNKGNKTPYEYFGADNARWQAFLNRNSSYRQTKKDKLTRISFTEEEANEYRQRIVERPESKYIASFLAQFIKDNLLFAKSDHKRLVQTRNGLLTALLRNCWGVGDKKIRAESDTHHALDAVIIACATEFMMQNIGDYSKQQELLWKDAKPGSHYYVSADTHTGQDKAIFQRHRSHKWRFPLPWQTFRNDLLEALDHVFVSRPPKEKISGQAHEETIMAKVSESLVRKRIPLTSITKSSNKSPNIRKTHSQRWRQQKALQCVAITTAKP